MNRQELAQWDLLYRLISPLLDWSERFAPGVPLYVFMPAALFLALSSVDVFGLLPDAGGQVTPGNAIGLPLSFLISPAFAALYFWMPQAIESLIQQMPERAALKYKSTVQRHLSDLQRRLACPALPASSFVIATGATIWIWWRLPGGIPDLGLESTGGRAIFTYVVAALVLYFVAMSFCRGLLVTALLVRLLRRDTDISFSVDPLDPDGVGGWAAWGEYFFGLLIAVVIGSVAVSIGFYTETLKGALQQLIGAIALVAIAIVTIALPLWLVYQIMRPSRDAATCEIRERRRQDYKSMITAAARSSGDVASWLSSLRSLDEAEEYVRDRYPVVPFRRPSLLTIRAVTSFSIVITTTSATVMLIRTI